MGNFFVFFFYNNEKDFYNFCYFIVDESVETSNVVFLIQNLKEYVKKY